MNDRTVTRLVFASLLTACAFAFSLGAPIAGKTRATEQVTTPQGNIGYIAVRDFQEPDGDAVLVRVESDGRTIYSKDIPLTGAFAYMAIPYNEGYVVEITALDEGAGGGVTLGFMGWSDAGETQVVLAKGDSIRFTIGNTRALTFLHGR